MGLDKDGICIYIKATDEAEVARKLLAETSAKELKGDEGEKLLKASGMRLQRRPGRGRCLGSTF